MKASTRQWLFCFTTVLWMGMIFYFSSIPNLKSPLPTDLDYLLRKIAHATEYAILYFLLWKSFQGKSSRISLALLVTISYAISDEFHQYFVPGRTASVVDVAIDIAGMLAAFGILRLNRNSRLKLFD